MFHGRRTRAFALALGLLILGVYLLSGSSDLRHNGDTDLRYQTAQAIVDHGRLWIGNPMWNDSRVALGRGHRLYAFYAPGQVSLMIPLYLFGKILAHHASLPYDVTTLYAARSIDLWLGALLAVLFFLVARRLGYSNPVAAVLTLILAFATVIWPDAQSALEQTQVDLLLLLGVYGLIRFTADREAHWLVLAGLGTGLAIFTRYDAIIYLPIVALYVAYVRYRSSQRDRIGRDWAVLAVTMAPWGILLAVWNWLRFGSPFITGLHQATFGEPVWNGVANLLVSPGKGLFWYLPLVFLLPWCVRRFHSRVPAITWLFAAIVVVSLLFYANVLYWHGDPAWGPRYLYAAVPYLILPLGELLVRWPRLAGWKQVVVVGLVALSLVINVSAVSVNQWRFWYRLELAQEHTSQPFRWGAQYYHYYWDVRWSPILIQLDNVYQVVRLNALGDQGYNLTARPTACTPSRCISNPADNYPINTLAFWWADTRQPLFGARTRELIAALLCLLSLGSAAWLGSLMVRATRRESMPGPGAVPIPASASDV